MRSRARRERAGGARRDHLSETEAKQALALIAGLAVLVPACGEDSVAVDDYANDLCTALTGWTQALRDRQAELQEGVEPGRSPEEDRDALQQFVEGAVEESDALVDDVEAAGEPDIEDGGEVADAFRTAVQDTRDELEEARDDVAQIPTDPPGAYRTAVEEFTTEVRNTLEGIDERFQDVDAPELDMALDEASACQG